MPDGIVDIGDKPDVPRRAVAAGVLRVDEATVQAIRDGKVEKGDVREAARIAAIQAVKDTPRIVPHCHPIPITSIDVDVDVGDEAVEARVAVEATYKTGVEMEALTGVSAALLTVWDMVKPFEKDADGQYPHTRIDDVRVVEKKVLREEGG